jgi:tRNA 2-selenouridine synthase
LAIQLLTPEEFLSHQSLCPILDVRSPGEYNHAHIPGAYNLPLFNDEERVLVGTAYKQESREPAIKIGLDFFGPKMRSMVEQAEKWTDSGTTPSEKSIRIHCWRGGMRSGAVAWLLDLYGFKVYMLQGGYKAFRNWVLDQFTKTYNLHILGGNTGSGKTYTLYEMQRSGAQMIDLEGLAKHKGSAFGNIGMGEQPSQEMFENLLAATLNEKSANNEAIWLEDESQRIGHVNVPSELWQNMSRSPLYFIDIPFDERLDFLVKEYGSLEKERLVNAVIRIKKRLGGLETKNAVNYLIEDNIKESFSILLKYYDKSYSKSLYKKENITSMLHTIPCQKVAPADNSVSVLSHAHQEDKVLNSL